ncbi:MAG: DUF6797 domain-containing protein, partial [Verrucomicrobiota bacterium]
MLLTCLLLPVLASGADTEPLPFPQNRLRDFYANQARQQLRSDRPTPKILPAFPGLDGGIFGHWGQNTEAKYADDQLNAMEIGSVISQTVRHFGATTPRAIVVRLGEFGETSAIFDPDRLTFTDAWVGGVRWESRRFGLNNGIKPEGARLLDLRRSKWTGSSMRYRGLFRHGERVIFHYEIGGVPVFDHLWMEHDQLIHSISVEG